MTFQKVVLSLTFLNSAVFLCVCLAPFLSSPSSWPIGMMGFGFPFLLIFQLLCLIFWAIRKSKWVLLPLLCMALGSKQISVVGSFHFFSKTITTKPENGIRVMSWNVSRWDERNKEKRGGASYRKLMFDLIEFQNVDILCVQEFFECYAPEQFEENIPALEKIGFKYHHFFPSSLVFEGKFQYGLAIFSRFPIVNTGEMNELPSTHSEGLAFADIVVNTQPVRIYNTHLESPGIREDDFSQQRTIKPSRSLLYKLKSSYALRNKQASLLKREMKKSPYPSILCANLGTVPNSFAYFEARQTMKDAFLEKGSGLGRTIRFISPTLRTDYIFLDRSFKVESFNRLIVPYSDHYPIISDFTFSNK